MSLTPREIKYGSVHGGGVISVWIDGVFFCRFLSGLGWSPRQAV